MTSHQTQTSIDTSKRPTCLFVISSSKRTDVTPHTQQVPAIPLHFHTAKQPKSGPRRPCSSAVPSPKPKSHCVDQKLRSSIQSPLKRWRPGSACFQGEHRDTKNIQQTHSQGPNPTEQVSQGILCIKQSAKYIYIYAWDSFKFSSWQWEGCMHDSTLITLHIWVWL